LLIRFSSKPEYSKIKAMRFPLFVLLVYCLTPALAQYTFESDKLIADLKFLSSDKLEGRKTGSTGNAEARQHIINELKTIGVTPFGKDYGQQFSFTQTFGMVEAVKGCNILGVISGNKAETIVLSAHYDHVGINNNQVYNGADDNASGTAALLAIARLLKKQKPNHRIIIAFFDAEEKGLNGSAHFVNALDLPKENIVLNVNLDMVARSATKTLYACGGYHYPHVKAILEKVKTPDGITLEFGYDDPILKRNDWTNQSDHYNFHLKKIPFVYFGVEDHEDYHRPTDDFEKINQDFFKRSVETIVRSVLALDKHLQ
jgi:Zn-dependent M28 family amino/carboxypeptidase